MPSSRRLGPDNYALVAALSRNVPLKTRADASHKAIPEIDGLRSLEGRRESRMSENVLSRQTTLIYALIERCCQCLNIGKGSTKNINPSTPNGQLIIGIPKSSPFTPQSDMFICNLPPISSSKQMKHTHMPPLTSSLDVPYNDSVQTTPNKFVGPTPAKIENIRPRLDDFVFYLPNFIRRKFTCGHHSWRLDGSTGSQGVGKLHVFPQKDLMAVARCQQVTWRRGRVDTVVLIR